MTEPLARLEPELDELLESERTAHPPNAATLTRIWSRVVAPAGLPSLKHASKPGLPSPEALRTPWGPATTISALVVGIATGALLYAVLHPPPPVQFVYVDRSVPVASTQTRVSEVAPVPASASVPVLVPVPVPAPPPTLSVERAVLEQARTALTSGDATRALALTDAYARRFPRPHFGEEREAIAIQALVVGGRYAEARTRAARFAAQSPNSLFRPVVDASLASIP